MNLEFDPAAKEAAIKKEESRLKLLFGKIEPKSKSLAKDLIQNAAFLSVTLSELQKKINLNGVTEKYQNGANQFGTKISSDAMVYNTMVKNFSNIIKQLTDFLPKDKRPETDGFDDFINGK